jgi:hypothetical protein
MHFLLGERQSQSRPVSSILGPITHNIEDYLTKHGSPAHQKRMQEIYIHANE